jgi:N-acetylglutamate synthase-like GNAT family acetyltransferase
MKDEERHEGLGSILRQVARLQLQIQRSRALACEGTTSTQCFIISELGRRLALDDGLLRSVAVAGDERGRGTGARLVERALSNALGRGLHTVTLLTTTAADYFPRFGFREVGRDDVPSSVRASDEFRSVCPSTATVMIVSFE